MLVIIGCGNTNRSDDGAGVWIIQELRRRGAPSSVELIDAGTGGMDVMFHIEDATRVILVDAVRSGAAPGTLYKVPGHELAALPSPGNLSLHDFRWDHALAVGRMIHKDRFPSDIEVYLIEAGSLEYGLELTPEVRASAERVVAMISRELDRTS